MKEIPDEVLLTKLNARISLAEAQLELIEMSKRHYLEMSEILEKFKNKSGLSNKELGI